ncbi:hypothetical protein [Catenulispora pinisilvae]|uniref:hypothetical protein n=1 Tax=Catenulispora pinisilvae TaxID=2705253 RepID=UPI00189107B5|nr:hypothetical protein [Catenulispora pinisilvae]
MTSAAFPAMGNAALLGPDSEDDPDRAVDPLRPGTVTITSASVCDTTALVRPQTADRRVPRGQEQERRHDQVVDAGAGEQPGRGCDSPGDLAYD